MSRLLLWSLLVILVVAIIVSEARPKRRRRRKLASLARTRNRLKRIKGRVEFPVEMQLGINVEGLGSEEIRLKKNRRMLRPKRTRAGRRRKNRRRKRRRRKEIAFYTGTKGSFACLAEDQNGQTDCNLMGLYTKGQERCYVKGNSTTCEKAAVNGYYESILPPGYKDPATTPGRRKKRAINPTLDYRVVELVVLADKGFMDRFYDDHPGNITAAEEEAELYAMLMINEVSFYYQSVVEQQRALNNGETLDIFMWMSAFEHPGHGKNFPWSEALLKTGKDGVETISDGLAALYGINDYIAKGNVPDKFDHVMAVTGYRLSGSSGAGLLGIAFVGTTCTMPNFAISLIEDLSFEAASTAAHEIGHSLGAKHDDVNDNGCPKLTNIMSARRFSPTPDTLTTFNRFSSCSIKYFAEHIESNTDCLAGHNFTETQFLDDFCLGARGSNEALDYIAKQCRMKFPHIPGTQPCAGYNPVPAKACAEFGIVKCTDAAGKCTQGLNGLWDFTPCVDDNSFCFRGGCVPKFTACAESSPNTTVTTPQHPTGQGTQTPTSAAPRNTLTTQEPSTQAPTTQAPTTQAPTTPAPTTRASITRPPIIRPPITRPPIIRKPITWPPIIRPPITRPPIIRTQTTETPRTKKRRKNKKKGRGRKKKPKKRNRKKKTRSSCKDCSKSRNRRSLNRCCKRCTCACCPGCPC